MSKDAKKKNILGYQESCDAGEHVPSISGWFQKAKKAKRRVSIIRLSTSCVVIFVLSFDQRETSFWRLKHLMPCTVVCCTQLWPGQSKFERRYLTLAGYQLHYHRYAF